MKRVLILLAAFAFVVLIASPANAAGPLVNINDPGCSDTTGTPFCHIQPAIDSSAPGTTITVAPGTYYENLTITRRTEIVGVNEATTIIDGGGKGSVVSTSNSPDFIMIKGVTIQHGSAVDGGGIFNQGNLRLLVSTVKDNTATGFGGGICSFNGGTIQIVYSTFTGNQALRGGGISNGGCRGGSGGNMSVVETEISANSASDGGGAINEGGTLLLSEDMITGNSAGFEGGGVYNGQNAVETITSSTLNNNVAHTGGGVWNQGALSILISTFTNNNGIASGGALMNNAPGSVNINGGTFGNNTGSGIVGASPITLQNTIVANSTVENCYGGIISQGYNLSSDNTCHLTATGDLNNADPRLGPLQKNGGPTLTRALLPGSPAIDEGNPGPNDGNGTHCLPDDQREVVRTGRCDIGAYEYP